MASMLLVLLPLWFIEAPPWAKFLLLLGGSCLALLSAIHGARVACELMTWSLRLVGEHMHEARPAAESLVKASQVVREEVAQICQVLRSFGRADHDNSP